MYNIFLKNGIKINVKRYYVRGMKFILLERFVRVEVFFNFFGRVFKFKVVVSSLWIIIFVSEYLYG